MSTHDMAMWTCPTCGAHIEAEQVVDEKFTPRVKAHQDEHAEPAEEAKTDAV